METLQVWLTIISLLLASTLITVCVYLALVLRAVRKSLTVFEAQIDDLKPILDFFTGVITARKQAPQSFSKKETLNSSCSFDAGRIVTDWALTGLTLWKTLHNRRKP
jgi:hypothetical protein